MSAIHIDTHIVLWLEEDPQRFMPAAVRRLLDDASELAISPMVLLELALLHEVGRIGPEPDAIFGSLSRTMGLKIDATPFDLVVEAALDITWTRAPFDRLIVAQSLAAGVPLVTADKTILTHCPSAVWRHAAD